MALHKHELEKRLIESEDLYRVISELTSDFAHIFYVESDGTLVPEWVSAAFTDITGFTPDEIKSRGDWTSLIHPDDLAAFLKRMEVVLTGQSDDSELRIIDRHGSTRWLRVYSRPEWDEEQGRVVRIIGAARDITKRRRSEQLLLALNQAALAMEKALTPQGIFAAATGVLEQLGFSCMILLTNEDKTHLFPRYVSHETLALKTAEKPVALERNGLAFPIENVDTYRKVIWQRQAVFSENAEGMILQSLPKSMRKLAARVTKIPRVPKAVVAPLIVGEDAIGALSVQSKDLIEDDIPAITAFAHQVAAAWRRAQLFERAQQEIAERSQVEDELGRYRDHLEELVKERTAELTRANEHLQREIAERKRAEEALRQRNRELASLNRASQALSSTLDLDQVLATFLEEVRGLLDAVACSAWLVDPETDEIVCWQAIGPQNEAVRGWRLAPGEGIAGQTARSGESLVVPDTQADARYYEGVDQQTGLSLRSILSVPLKVKEDVIGVLQVVDTEASRFSLTDLDVLEPLAAAAASHIENARLYQEAASLWTFNENIVQSMEEGIVLLDATGYITFVNRKCAEVLRYGSEELTGRHWKEAIAPEHLAAIEEEMGGRPRAIEGQYETALLTHQGRQVPVILSARPLYDGGRFSGVLSVFTDITERKRMEEALAWEAGVNAAIAELSQALISPASLEDISSLVLDLAKRLTRSKLGYVGYIDPKTDHLSLDDPLSSEVPPDRIPIQRSLSAPALIGETPVGQVTLADPDHDYTEQDRALVERLASLYALAIQRRRAEAEIQRRNQELAIVNTIAATVSRSLNLYQILEDALDEMMQLDLLVAEATGMIFLLNKSADGQAEELELVAYRGAVEGCPCLTRLLPVGECLCGLAVQRDEAIISGDSWQDEGHSHCWPEMPPHKHICLPLRSRGQVLGILSLWLAIDQEVTESDLRLLTAISDQIGMATGNARLYEEARQRAGELAALNRTSQIIASSLDLDKVLAQAMAEARAMLGAEGASVLLYDADSDELVFAAAASPASEVLVGARMPAAAGVAGWALRQGQPVLVRDTHSDPRFYDRIDDLTDLDTRTLIAVPLQYKETVIGVIEAINKVGNPFNGHDLDLAIALANSTAVAIENARLFEAEREQRHLVEQSQAHLIHTEKMAALGRLAASIAHEINNPLQAVLGCMRLAEEELQGRSRAEKLERHLSVAMNETRRISAILHRMHDFYRRAREGLQPTDVHTILESVLALSAKQLQHSHVVVERDWAGDLPLIQANADHLRQVLLNLLINAIDAMPQGGTLSICTAFEKGEESKRPGFLRIEFSDTGVGMSPEVQARLFEPFFTTKENGTGLGLSISYGIIEAHNGQITVDSREGEGTTFTILLPAGQL